MKKIMNKIWGFVAGYIVAGVLFYGLKFALAFSFDLTIRIIDPNSGSSVPEFAVSIATIIAAVAALYVWVETYKRITKPKAPVIQAV
jgi:hypothetical protein